MALLEYNEIKQGKVIIYEDEPCEVMESHVARTQQRKPQNQTKLKSLMTGRTYNATFQGSDRADEADISKRDIKFLYHNKGEYWFCDPTEPANRFKLEEKVLGASVRFLQPNEIVSGVVYTDEDDEEKIISVKLPIKMTLIVKETAPSIKGSTITNSNKPATLENDAVVNVPMFVNAGDKIVVNTDTGEYVERA